MVVGKFEILHSRICAEKEEEEEEEEKEEEERKNESLRKKTRKQGATHYHDGQQSAEIANVF